MANFTVKLVCISMAALALVSPVASWASGGAEASTRISPCTAPAAIRTGPAQEGNVETEAQSLARLYLLPIPMAALDTVPAGLVVPLSAQEIERMDADELQVRITATEKLIADLTAQMPPAAVRQPAGCFE